jgi:hypothetical protein
MEDVVPDSHSRLAQRRAPVAPLAVVLAAFLLAGLAAVPAPVGAATQAMVPACSAVNLRAGATR